MEKQEMLEALNGFITQIDALKNDSGPKSPEFIKWLRDVKQFIEKNYGADFNKLRELKKIDYYPKKFDILSSESAFKKAWEDGIESVRAILASLKREIEGVSVEVEDVSEQIETDISEEKGNDSEVKTDEEKKPKEEEPSADEKEKSEAEELPQEKKQEASENKKDSKKTAPAPAKEKDSKETKESKKERKVLLVNISDEKLNTSIYKFVKIMGYEPVVIDQDIDGDVFMSDSLEEAMSDSSVVYAITLWKADLVCEGKKTPKERSFFSTGYLAARLSNRNVLILHSNDIKVTDDNYAGLHFLEIDNIQELMELKIAREMDDAGLDIDFNFFKKK